MRSLGRLVDAGDEIEDRGFAGAIRSDQAHQFLRTKVQIDNPETAVNPPKRIVTSLSWSNGSFMPCAPAVS